MKILGNKVILRAIETEDLPRLHTWGNEPELWDMLGGWHFPTCFRDLEEVFESWRKSDTNRRFAIEAPGLGMIGMANLVDIDWKNNHAFHGMIIGESSARGKGFGVDTIMAVMRYAFDELHFQRLDGSIIEYNQTSHSVYVGRCGWKEEGRQRSWYFRKGRYWDKILVGVTKSDYADLLGQSDYWNQGQ